MDRQALIERITQDELAKTDAAFRALFRHLVRCRDAPEEALPAIVRPLRADVRRLEAAGIRQEIKRRALMQHDMPAWLTRVHGRT